MIRCSRQAILESNIGRTTRIAGPEPGKVYIPDKGDVAMEKNDNEID
jgi:hypothetical protein